MKKTCLRRVVRAAAYPLAGALAVCLPLQVLPDALLREAGFPGRPGTGVFFYCFVCLWVLRLLPGAAACCLRGTRPYGRRWAVLRRLCGSAPEVLPGPGRRNGAEAAGRPSRPAGPERVPLRDERGVLRLALRPEDIRFIEVSGNYAAVHYTGPDGLPARYLLRCRLHVLETHLYGTPLVRCSRNRIVNLEKIRLLRKEEDGYVLELETGPVAVTRTYEARVLAALGL